MDTENKQKILDYLLLALKETRAQHDLKALWYDPQLEQVIVRWKEGRQVVNVSCDSGIAMIKDVLSAIE